MAQTGGRGGAALADLPAFCRVAATLTPTRESDIKIEVWLPMAGWNGKLQAVGNGGWNGNIDTNALAGAVRRGYAGTSTDTGHTGGAGPWMQNTEKLADWAYRSVHETAVAAKALINAFYGEAPKFSYFTGCSAGGPPGDGCGAALPGGFRRHRCRLTRAGLDQPRHLRRPRQSGIRTRPGSQGAGGKVRSHQRRRDERLRRERRRQGRGP